MPRAVAAVLLLLVMAVPVEPVRAEALSYRVLDLLKAYMTQSAVSYEFNISGLAPISADEAADRRRQIKADNLIDIHVEAPIHASGGWFLLRDFYPVLCFLQDQIVEACVYGLGLKWSGECEQEYFEESPSPSNPATPVVACSLTALSGTGIAAYGKAYFLGRPPFTFMGYLPHREYVSGMGMLEPGTLIWEAADRTDPETPDYLERCVTISYQSHAVEDAPLKAEERCDAYRIDAKAGRIVHLKGANALGDLLMNVYQDTGIALSEGE